ncbi:MAG: electron transfer flavoprotein beta subunit/FixA family protein [Actinomycetota bacterium]|nr:electron transfer flavoprotein beta subunit/FixA family protein [Actinomycetota bacterium]
MRVLVCVKRVPAPGARINITPDGLAVDTAYLAFTTSPHEECAVEEAVQLVERHGGESTVLTLGPAEADEQLRYAASIGVNKAVLLPIDSAEWDPQRTATAITTAIRTLEAADGPFDVILFGNESADAGNFQVGVRVAHALARPIVNGIKGIEVDGDSLKARRESDAGVEVYALTMPVVLGVKEGINLPRYPTLKGRLGSKKIEVGQVVPEAVLGGQQMVSLVQSAEQVSQTIMLGNGPEAAPAVVDLLEELGILK